MAAVLPVGQLSQCRLFYYAKGADFVATMCVLDIVRHVELKDIPRTDDTDDARENQNPVVVADGKHDAAHAHERGADDEDALPAQAVGEEDEDEADDDVAQQRQRHEQADARVREAQRRHEEGEDQRRGTVCKHTHEALQA